MPPAAMLLASLLWTRVETRVSAASHDAACLLALDAHAGARGDAFRDGDADGRGSRSFRVSCRVCVERIGVLPIGSTSINLGLVSYKIDCKLIELKPPILLYTKMYFIFWGPFKFGGPVRSHSPHGPKDAPDEPHQGASCLGLYRHMSATSAKPSFKTVEWSDVNGFDSLIVKNIQF